MLTCLTDSKKIRLLSCRLTTLPQIVSERSLLRQNVQESNHSTHFLLAHPLSKAELLLFFFPLFFFKIPSENRLPPQPTTSTSECCNQRGNSPRWNNLRVTTESSNSPFWRCALLLFVLLLYFFFHLFEHCSPATLTNDLAFNCSATLSLATFFHTLLLSKRSVFSSRKEINSLVLFDDHVISFSPFSSSAMK